MSSEQRFLDLIAGRSEGVGPAIARGVLRAIEPLFAAGVKARNRKYDRGAPIVLPRPTISVGNITTGGTGKTPVVLWLAERLIERGHSPAVLLRGYRQRDGVSDEAELYRADGLAVGVNPDRVAGATAALAERPQTDMFLLDDGFQHRRVARAIDLVLIDATNPFGYGHLLPRGLLREPPSALARAGAIVITRSDRTNDLERLITSLRGFAHDTPILKCRHAITGLVDASGQAIEHLALGPATAVAGIGNPTAFFDGLRRDLGIALREKIVTADHAHYDAPFVQRLASLGPIVTTEKDWAKLQRVSGIERVEIYRTVLRIEFESADGERLIDRVRTAIGTLSGSTPVLGGD